MNPRSKKLVWHKLAGDAKFPTANYYRVLMRVFDYSGPTGARAHPGNQRLAKECQMSVGTVKTVLRWLVEEGWLRLGQRGGRAGNGAHWASEYALSTPPGIPNPLDEVEARDLLPERDILPVGVDILPDVVRYDAEGNGYDSNGNLIDPDPWAQRPAEQSA